MLKVNVGFSRKVSRDYNSTGFSVNLEGEVCAAVDDPELVIEKIKELYDLAEESLNQQIKRHESESAIAQRDAEPSTKRAAERPARAQTSERPRPTEPAARTPPGDDGNGRPVSNGGPQPATNKQVQFLLTLGKRFGLTTPQLEQRATEIIGRPSGLYELTKDEAGRVLDQLTEPAKAGSSRRR